MNKDKVIVCGCDECHPELHYGQPDYPVTIQDSIVADINEIEQNYCACEYGRRCLAHDVATEIKEKLEPYFSELRALLAERDALRERERQLKQLVHQWNENAKDTGFVRIPNYAPQVYENCADELQSILNATLSEGERG